MINIKDVSFGYDENLVFSSLSLHISEKEIVAIVGNSGCGKSTLLNLIAGVLQPSKGEVSVSTNDFSYLMQEITLLPYQTALENVLLAFSLRNVRVTEETKRIAIMLLKQFHIEKSAFQKYPHELSGGMKQRIALVQTLLTNPQLLLLDEPFNAIDISALESIETYLWNYIKDAGRTMIYITHNIDHALLLSDRIIVMGNHNTVTQIIPTQNYSTYSPSHRTSVVEYKKLFFEIVEKIKS